MGRTAMMFVICFNVIFMVMGFTMSDVSSRAYVRYTNYYKHEESQYVVQSAVNMGIARIFNGGNCDTNWTPPAGNIQLQGTDDFFTLNRQISGQFRDTITIIAGGTCGGFHDTSIVTLIRRSFSQFTNYSVNEGGLPWIKGDTCFGRYHTQDYIYLDGQNPNAATFMKMATTKLGKSGTGVGNFYGGYASGVDNPLPSSCAEVISQTGKTWSADTYIQFFANGQVAVNTGGTSWTTGTRTVYANIGALTSTNVALVNGGGDLHVKGTLSGQITLGCVGSGHVYLDSSLVYNVAPVLSNGTANPACTDMLGIVADGDFQIPERFNGATSGSNYLVDLKVDGSIFSRTGGIIADNYAGRAIGTFTAEGGLQLYQRKSVGTHDSNGNRTSGFAKNFHEDPRLSSMAPKAYPSTKVFQVCKWFESAKTTSAFWDNELIY